MGPGLSVHGEASGCLLLDWSESCVASLSACRFDVRVGILGAGGPLDDSGVSTMGGGGKALLGSVETVTVVRMVVDIDRADIDRADKDRAENAGVPWTWVPKSVPCTAE
jgi:hypothetical protein